MDSKSTKMGFISCVFYVHFVVPRFAGSRGHLWGNAVSEAFAHRGAGVLLHPTSLPGPGPNGRLDAAAYRFVDWLAAAGFRVWQMLPIGPLDPYASPYQPPSACAGGTHLLDPSDPREPQAGEVEAFAAAEAAWLDDWTLFAALHARFDRPWPEWPTAERDRDPDALAAARAALADAIDAETRAQWRFARQWAALRSYAAQRGVYLFGDLPIYCALDSADVWAHRDLFAVDDQGRVTAEAGVPPDAFAELGQRWGQPLYDWAAHAAGDWQWWIERVRVQAERFDLLRVDHFRGFAQSWSIPPQAADARAGEWVDGPGRAPFDAIAAALGQLPLIAEDLGTITPDVDALRDELGLPGMRVLQFAFDGGEDNPHRPEHHPERAVAYTGTHDNNTTLGWWQALDPERAQRARAALGVSGETMPWPLMEAAFASPARLVVVPLQDLLGLGGEARMNVPGQQEGNWRWRYAWTDLTGALARACRAALAASQRLP